MGVTINGQSMVFKRDVQSLRKAIGEEICHLRLSMNLTQTALGEAIGVTQHQVQRYEAGEGALTVDRLAAIASVLNVHPGHFFGRTRPRTDFGRGVMMVCEPAFATATDENLKLAEKIAMIRDDAQRRDILQSIEETVDLLLRSQGD